MTTKLPLPADITAEARVLGAMLYDQRHVSALPSQIRPESFYSEAHRQIFAAIDELRGERVDVNTTTVEARLRKKGRLPQLPNGGDFLDALVDDTPALTPSSFAALAKIVADKATQRATLLLLQRASARLSDPTLADVNTSLADVERELLQISLKSHDSGGLRHIKAALRAEVAEWGERAMGRGKPGTATGFAAYDGLTGGLHQGDLVIVAARPGMGKTAWATSIATNVARRPNQAAALFSLEMLDQQLAGRMLSTESGIPLTKTRTGRLEPNELTRTQMALSELAQAGVYVDDARRGRPYVADIISRTRRKAAELAREGKRLAVVVVDYIQIVRLREELQRQRHDLAIGEVVTELKALAKELETCVIALSQLNRSVESRQDKRPNMGDLKDSSQIEQDADLIVMLYRDEYYDPETREPGIVELIFEKNRHGPTGTRRMRFDGPTTKFSDAPEEE